MSENQPQTDYSYKHKKVCNIKMIKEGSEWRSEHWKVEISRNYL